MKHKLWISGKWQESQNSGELKKIYSPFDNKQVSEVCWANDAQLKEAILASEKAFQEFRFSKRYVRSELLKNMAAKLSEKREAMVELMVQEAGKPVMLAQAEVARALVTFTVASEEAKRFSGEVIAMDIEPSAAVYDSAVSYWVPRGPVLGITPFNFPLNLVAHKLAPALASGNSIIIKAAPQTPGPANLLVEIFKEALEMLPEKERAQVPLSTFQLIHCSNELTEKAVTHEKIATVSFTGSVKVGWHIQSKAVGKKLALELGGNAAAIVHEDADLKRAALRCAVGGFAYAGQSCISVQRVFVHAKVRKEFESLLLEEIKKISYGDPHKKDLLCGPVINAEASKRILSWIDDAKKNGAQVLTGGKASGNVIEPTLLTNVNSKLDISCQEVFGPVVILESYDDFSKAIQSVNQSQFGLHAGVFTKNIDLIQKAIHDLEVGGVLINEVPTYRADHLPYGGVKMSGLGREGLRYAMEEYSERKTVIRWTGV